MSSLSLIEEAENQIVALRKLVDYQTLEYPIEVIVDKYLRNKDDDENEIFIPQYQRAFVWSDDRQSKFIESLFLGLPIPFLFLADATGDYEGRLEVVDGSQRIRTLARFIKNGLQLIGLRKLDKLNGMEFSYLPKSRQMRFLRTNIKTIILTDKADDEARKDIFERINTGSDTLRAMEVRKGLMSGTFYSFVEECADNPLFQKLAPVSKQRESRQEYSELILRFFAYLDDTDSFVHRVDQFMDGYLEKMNNSKFDKASYKSKFENMLQFIERTFPYGFRKSQNAKSTPRVRFETLAVGAALALEVKPNLVCNDINWLDSEEFQKHTRSHGSNDKKRLISRIHYVRDKFLGK